MGKPDEPTFDAAGEFERLLDLATSRCASDLHLEPTADGYETRLRVDGLLETLDRLDAVSGRMLATRLMVMAQLLTYRLDIPQEGRLSAAPKSIQRMIDLRLSVIPTVHGLRAVLRLPAELSQPRTINELDLPTVVLGGLCDFASADSGMLLLTGPAGSGKTTTIYALLQFIADTHKGLSIVSLEDPVERTIAGITQIEVSPFGQLTYECVLRSMLRQDPQVLVLGEIRDEHTAKLAAQAALTGHRLISTLHAGSIGGAVVRLLEMGLEPYQLASSLFGIVALRLVRRCDGRGGHCGRAPLAELARIDSELRDAILHRENAQAIDRLLTRRPDHQTLDHVAADLVQRQITDPDEIRRVLGGRTQ